LLKNISAGQIDKILTGDAGNETTNIQLTVKGEDGKTKHNFTMQKAVMDSQGFSQGLDDNETIELTFSTQIGGVNQTDQGFFYSGANADQKVGYDKQTYTNNTVTGGFYYPKFNTKGKYSQSEDG